jgi:RNA polymerase sigma factor (TIGR02999 family)
MRYNQISCITFSMQSDPQPLTTLLAGWRAGDQRAASELFEAVYDELRSLASHYLRRERPGHTLQATAVVNEAFVRLSQSAPVEWHDRMHFFAIAARQLRRVLVNHARERHAEKRGGERVRLALTEVNGLSAPQEQDLLDLDRALTSLEEADERAARVIELRFFAGLTEAEAAEALGISVATLKRDWAFGRAWLVRHLGS